MIGPDGVGRARSAYLRPGTRLARGAKVGAFVETKNVEVGEGSKVPHLSYVGDATIGDGTNIGAATVFVNYDGVAKHHTTDRVDHVRIGSDNMLVAPVTVGDGAYTAAGLRDHHRRPPGGHGRRAGAPAECGRLGSASPLRDARGRGRGGSRESGGGAGYRPVRGHRRRTTTSRDS